MSDITSSKDFEAELTRIFNRFNHHFWNDELPEVIISFKPTRNAYGHLSIEKVWVSNEYDSKYEMNISAYTINRKPEEICATILHEQCHLYCRINNINETSNNFRYHNALFKRIAETHGLSCKKYKYYGWSNTSLSEDGIKYVKKLNIKQFSFKYIKPSKKVQLSRFVCPACEKTKAWVSSPQNLICGNCFVKLIYSPIE